MDWSKWEKQHWADTRRYQQQLAVIYRSAAQEAAAIGASVAYFDPSKPFSFTDYPQTKVLIDKLTNSFSDRIEKVIVNGVDSQWTLSNNKNNELCNWVFGDLKSKLTQVQQRRYYSNNDTARKAFAARAAKGTKLSDRVWEYTDQFKVEIELGIDLGLREGLSAADMARDLKQYLQQPEKLFRRVRDEHGVLRLSQAAKAYRPGRGVYRSSYKNALRLTATETNMAYRTADHERWQQLDFVIGVEVKRSNNQCNCPLCSSLAGKYPKDFKFTGWHPNCRCHAIPILQKIDDFAAGKSVADIITDTPQGFNNWINENKGRFTDGSTPYFIRDNSQFTNPVVATSGSRISFNTPPELMPGSKFLQGEDYIFDADFFNLLDSDKPIRLEMASSGGTHFSPSGNLVRICDDARMKASDWERKAVVYHEYGHAIDWQRGLRGSKELLAMRAKQIKWLKELGTYKVWIKQRDYVQGKYVSVGVEQRISRVAYIDHRLESLCQRFFKMQGESFKKYGITKEDALEQICSVRDTIMSLDPTRGYGHSKKYFKLAGKKEAEYLAHAFENAFLGNRIFQKYLPSIYDEMIAFVRQLNK